MVQAQGVGVCRPRGVEGNGLALHGIAALDAHSRLAQIDGGGVWVLAVGVGGAAEVVAGARGGGDDEVGCSDVVAGGVRVGHAVLSVHGIIVSDGVLARVAIGNGKLPKKL